MIKTWIQVCDVAVFLLELYQKNPEKGKNNLIMVQINVLDT